MKKTLLMVIVAVVLSACTLGKTETPPPTPAPEKTTPANYMAPNAVKTEAGTGASGSAVEAAIVAQSQCNKALGDLLVSQEKAHKAEEERQAAVKQVDQLKLELAQAQKELADANKMLMEMKGELDKWKKDVLGFRKEIIDAQAAQMDALQQIMKVLGSQLSEPTDHASSGPASQPAVKE